MLRWTLLRLPACRTLMDRASTPVQRSVMLRPWTLSDTQPEPDQPGLVVALCQCVSGLTGTWPMCVSSKPRLNIVILAVCLHVIKLSPPGFSCFAFAHRKQTACTTCSWTSSRGSGSCCRSFACWSASSHSASSEACRATATPSIRTSASACSLLNHCF